MALTKQDLQAIEGVVQTVIESQDIDGVVKKAVEAEDIKGVVEKAVDNGFEELAQMIQRDVVERMATKDDLSKVASDVGELKTDVADIKEHLGVIEESFAMPAELRFQSRKRPVRRAA